MNLIILVNGNLNNIVSKSSINDYKTIKIDEKDFINFKKVIQIIKTNKPNKLYFACKDIEFQRFIIFFKFYIMITIRNGAVIDENGIIDKFSFLKLLFYEIPLLIIETIFSVFVIFYNYIKLPFLKWIIYKKK